MSDAASGSVAVEQAGGATAPESIETLPGGGEQNAPRKRPWLFRAAGATRWVLAVPAVLLALYAEQAIRQALASPDRPPEPPLLSWQLYAVAGLLLALAAGAVRLMPAGASAFVRNVRSLRGKTR